MSIRENSMNINTTTYNKAAIYNPDGYHGYGPVTKNGPAKRKLEEIYSIIIHTTNGAKGSTFENEAGFLYRSPNVSAHYINGKAGQVVQILDPEWIAWHAGMVNDNDCDNYNSIGIENHITVGEEWTPEMHASLTELVTYLLRQYKSIRKIVTHRSVAVFSNGKLGRKVDPSGFDDQAFVLWRDQLLKSEASPYAIIGTASKPQDSVVKYIYKRAHGAYTLLDITSIVQSYYTAAAQVGVNPVVALGQMVLETGALSSWWAARPRRNPAGLGVNGETSHSAPGAGWTWDVAHAEYRRGWSFESWDMAARAHLGHLLCYALRDEQMTPAQLAMSNLSPRKSALPAAFRGCAVTLRDLNGRWTSGNNYGQSIEGIIQAFV